MTAIGQTFPITTNLKAKLRGRLSREPEIISYRDNPTLASLCTCLGLAFELGRKDFDRLSPFFNIDIAQLEINPWEFRIFTFEGTFGIEFNLKPSLRLLPRHNEIAQLIHKKSFDGKGYLDRIVINPAQVARIYEQRGFDLVVVKDWFLSSGLSDTQETMVPYLSTNSWEIANNNARFQVEMMPHRQIAFTGTHDIVDHLFGADKNNFCKSQHLFPKAQDIYRRVFRERQSTSSQDLILSYLIGVIFDDLAQPKWYGSKSHMELADMTLDQLKKDKNPRKQSRLQDDLNPGELFHKIVDDMRCGVSGSALSTIFDDLVRDLEKS